MQLFVVEREKMKGQRWDSNYWRTDLLLIIDQMKRMKFPFFFLKDVADVTIGEPGKRTFTSKGTKYLRISNLGETGILFNKKIKCVKEGGFNDPLRSRIKNGDLLFVISGGGSIGRVTFVHGVNEKINISQDIAKVSLKDFPLYSTYLFLQSKWGIAQIRRFENGTGVTHLNQNEVKHILVPKLPDHIEEWSKLEVNKLNELHNLFLKSKEENDLIKAEKTKKTVINQFEEMVFRYNHSKYND